MKFLDIELEDVDISGLTAYRFFYKTRNDISDNVIIAGSSKDEAVGKLLSYIWSCGHVPVSFELIDEYDLIL